MSHEDNKQEQTDLIDDESANEQEQHEDKPPDIPESIHLFVPRDVRNMQIWNQVKASRLDEHVNWVFSLD